MKILVFGANGQLGSIFCEKYRDLSVPLTSKDVDITNYNDVRYALLNIKPDIVINCAAYTDVAKAEVDLDLAYNVNATGAYSISSISKEISAKVIHISTDYVYNQDGPIYVGDKTNPINNYGKTKLDGDKLVSYADKNNLVIRTGSLFSDRGKNFILTLINAYKNGKMDFDIVDDMLSRPTSAFDLADVIYKNRDLSGTVHFSGDTLISWYDYAKLIFKFDPLVKINAVKSAESKVKRPMVSDLISTPIFDVSDFKYNLEKTLTLLGVSK
ncbi:putative dTDP-4-dehydrorhamnose reductase [Klebsiella phage 05F01]|nr:putative dTDP-4-dehydrorhamnose reductase [Klebsiella phage 05F01]